MKREPQQLSLFQAEQLTVQQVAKLLHCSESTIKRLLDAGELLSYQRCTRGQRFILMSSLVAYEAKIKAKCGLDNALKGWN